MIDTHCHITSEYYDNIDEVINKMKDNIIIVSGTNKDDIKEVINLCNYKNVYGTIGIYPTEELDLKIIEDNINNKKIVGIGEIGLDYHLETVVIHTRDAIQDTYDILKNYKDLKKVIHCYSGSLEMAKEFIKINCRLGIGGVLTFKNSKLKDVIKEIDLKYLLLETDSPFLTPEPYRGTKNEPYNIIYVAKKIAEIKDISLEEVLDITTKNAKEQFDLD